MAFISSFLPAWLRQKEQNSRLDKKNLKILSQSFVCSKGNFLLERFLSDQGQYSPSSFPAELRSDLQRLPRVGYPTKTQTSSSMSACSNKSIALTSEIVENNDEFRLSHPGLDFMQKLLEIAESTFKDTMRAFPVEVQIEAVYI